MQFMSLFVKLQNEGRLKEFSVSLNVVNKLKEFIL